MKLFGQLLGLDLVEHLDPHLDLGGLARLVAETLDVFLQLVAALLGVLAGGLGERGARFAFDHVLAVVAGIARGLAAVDLPGDIGQGVEQEAVVGDEQQRAGVDAQAALKPFHGGDIEVVGGFVEEQDVGFGEQDACHGGAHLPAAGKRVQRIVEEFLVEAESGERGFGTVPGVVAAEVFVGRLQVAEFVQQLRIGGIGLKRAFDLSQPRLDERQIARGGHVGQHVLLLVGKVDLLAQDADAETFGDHDLALVGRELPEDHAEDGGLAGAVRADHADAFALIDAERGVVEDGFAAQELCDVLEIDHELAIFVIRLNRV